MLAARGVCVIGGRLGEPLRVGGCVHLLWPFKYIFGINMVDNKYTVVSLVYC